MAEQESSLKLRPAEAVRGLTTEILSMEAVTGEEDCSLKMCATKRKAPTAGRLLPPLKGGAIKRKGEDNWSEGLGSAKIATLLVTMDEIVEQASSDTKVAASTQKAAAGTGFSELGKYVDAKKVEADMTMGEEEKASFPETKGTVPGATVKLDEISSYRLPYSVVDEIDWSEGVEDTDEDANLSEADFQLIVDRANAKYNQFIELLLARAPNPLVFKETTAADFVNSDDDEEVYA